MKNYTLKDMAGRTYIESATTRKNAIDQAKKRYNTYLYIVDNLKINYETLNRVQLSKHS